MKEYNKDDILIFEGEYLNEKRNGKGKEYDYKNFKNYLIFEGEYLNGKRNGKGKEYYFGELIFEGEYLNGKRNGKGKDFFINKILFEGEYLKGKKWNGKGYDINNNLIYELKNGKGYIKEITIPDFKIIFEGEYLNGERNGKGKEYYDDGNLKSEIEYLNGKKWKMKVYNEKKILFVKLKKERDI